MRALFKTGNLLYLRVSDEPGEGNCTVQMSNVTGPQRDIVISYFVYSVVDLGFVFGQCLL